jgi:large subunit ribosomal protein L10
MLASLSKAVYLFAAPLSQTARVVDALRAKLEAEAPAVVSEAPTESVDTALQDAPVAQDAVEAPAVTVEAPAVTVEVPEDTTKDVATGGDES